MISQTQIPKPENWQDFEKLCKKLWGEIWNCSSSIKKNGRPGQRQNGVDICVMIEGEEGYRGIQCKGKDDYSKSELTQKEIDKEISKALEFKPPLIQFIFTTTANKNTKIEEYIRKKNIENKNKGLFEIDIFSWEDIVDLLEERQDTYNWYVNNHQFKKSPNIEILLNDGIEFEIFPQYIRTTKIFVKKPDIISSKDPFFILNQQLKSQILPDQQFMPFNLYPWQQRKKIDYRWCTIPITIKNSGTTVIEDFKLFLCFDHETISGISDKHQPYNPGPFFDHSMIVANNNELEKNREVFESSQWSNTIEFRPKYSILVQSEIKHFKIDVKPKDDTKTLRIIWGFISRNYKKSGELLVKVTPKYDEEKKIIEVDEIQGNEIEIKPKIIER